MTARDSSYVIDCGYGQNTTVSVIVTNLSPQFTNETYYADVPEADYSSTPNPVLTVRVKIG